MNIQQHAIQHHSFAGSASIHTHQVLLVETCFSKSADTLLSKLQAQGFESVDVLNSAEGLLERARAADPSVLILSVDFLDAATLDQLVKVNQLEPVPVVVFARKHAPEIMKVVVEAGVSAYVVDEVQAHRLPVIIDLAIARFGKMQSLSTELEQTKEKLSERKLIEKAKGIIMQQKQLSEADAYVQMRKSAMDQGQSMAELSRRIINVFKMLD